MEGIWTIVVTATVTMVATLLTTWFGHWLGLSKDRVLRHEELDRHARYLAIRVVCSLDPFVSGCVEVVHDEGMPTPEDELEPDTATPNLSLPEDVDWRAVDTELMYRILGLPNEIAVADQSISFVAKEISTPPDHSEFFRERSIRYARLGVTAQKLADDLRTRYRIPAQDYGDWNPRQILELRLSKIEKQSSDHEARKTEAMREMWEDMEAWQPPAVSIASEARKF